MYSAVVVRHEPYSSARSSVQLVTLKSPCSSEVKFALLIYQYLAHNTPYGCTLSGVQVQCELKRQHQELYQEVVEEMWESRWQHLCRHFNFNLFHYPREVIQQFGLEVLVSPDEARISLLHLPIEVYAATDQILAKLHPIHVRALGTFVEEYLKARPKAIRVGKFIEDCLITAILEAYPFFRLISKSALKQEVLKISNKLRPFTKKEGKKEPQHKEPPSMRAHHAATAPGVATRATKEFG
eukprot:PhF_6_TR31551/c0_g2_i1/m.46595